MTERENALIVLNNGIPKWVPCFYDAYYPMGPSIINNSGAFMKGGKDMFGTVWAATEDTGFQVIPDPRVKPILDEIGDWREIVLFPDVEAMDWSGAAERDLAGYDRNEKLLTVFGMEGNFVRLQALMGVENAMIAMMEEPEEVYAFFEAYTDFRIELIEKTAQYYKPDIYVNADDVCSATGRFFSPAVHKQLIRPFEIKLGEAVVRHGMIHEQHCCGLCDDELIDHFIDMRASIWQMAQSMNDVARIKEKYGDKIIIHGGWDSFGPNSDIDATEEQTRAEVRRCIDSYAQGGNYMLFPVIIGDMADERNVRRRQWVSDECRTYSEEFYADPKNH